MTANKQSFVATAAFKNRTVKFRRLVNKLRSLTVRFEHGIMGTRHLVGEVG